MKTLVILWAVLAAVVSHAETNAPPFLFDRGATKIVQTSDGYAVVGDDGQIRRWHQSNSGWTDGRTRYYQQADVWSGTDGRRYVPSNRGYSTRTGRVLYQSGGDVRSGSNLYRKSTGTYRLSR